MNRSEAYNTLKAREAQNLNYAHTHTQSVSLSGVEGHTRFVILNKVKNLKTILPLFILLLPLFFSCSSKKINYLQAPEGTPQDSIYQQVYEEYKVQPGDILYVDIFSPDPEVSEIFNKMPASSGGGGTNIAQLGGFYIIGYTISPEGTIELPIMGTILVNGLTTEEIQEKVLLASKKYIKSPQVSVKLVSFTVTVLGEVGSPGRYTIYRDKMNILDIIGTAGDITYYGNRENVNIVRTIKEGSFTYMVDLTQRNLLASSKYFMAPNDIIYVQPRKVGLFRKSAADYALFLTTLTSTITTILLVVNLSK